MSDAINQSASLGGTQTGGPVPEEELPNIIQWVGDQFERMLLGIPRFLFVVAPRHCWRLLTDLAPWAVQLLRTAILASLWTLLVFGPLAFHELVYRSVLVEGGATLHSETQWPEWLRSICEGLQAVPGYGALLSGYTGLLVAGSFWDCFT